MEHDRQCPELDHHGSHSESRIEPGDLFEMGAREFEAGEWDESIEIFERLLFVDENEQPVSGSISIYNPATIAQTFSVSDVLDDSTPVTVTSAPSLMVSVASPQPTTAGMPSSRAMMAA